MASDENIFSNLNPKTLSDVTATDINRTTRDVHIERKNLDALKTTVLINKSVMRDGSPMPGTGVVESVNFAADTTGHQDVWRPDPGEVYLVSTISVKGDGGGDVNLSMSLENANADRALLDASTGTISAGTIIDMVNGPVYVSYDCFLQAYIGTNTNGATITIAAHRVR